MRKVDEVRQELAQLDDLVDDDGYYDDTDVDWDNRAFRPTGQSTNIEQGRILLALTKGNKCTPD